MEEDFKALIVGVIGVITIILTLYVTTKSLSNQIDSNKLDLDIKREELKQLIKTRENIFKECDFYDGLWYCE